ncbi:hypothetical protein HU200_061592 [Digitaria exilis]|uniref:Uncharacterized protein n=1 Tax=Digitaria exilis TaxID=1010633 RepID=A0A835A845_9POAL|nr:hypothetical protein HU200_061592 [Digitaria exilis]
MLLRSRTHPCWERASSLCNFVSNVYVGPRAATAA